MRSSIPSHPISSRLTLTMRWALVAVLGVLLISMATGQSGIANYLELKSNRESLSQVVNELSIENQKLETQLNKLKNSREAQVRFLKQEFGYIERNEYVYHFSRNSSSKKAQIKEADTKIADLTKKKI
jgi:cell division protein FtsB